jgi:flagellar assembly protein FliH
MGTRGGVAAAPIDEREEQVRLSGLEEGRAAAKTEYEHKASELRAEIGRAIAEFAAQRDSYFHAVEEQVVRLSLAIARKILHRESQIDPLLLAGIVRVTLEKIEGDSRITLRAHPAEINAWRDYFARTQGDPRAPELVGDPALARGRCVVETELGTTEIGLDSQLQEIEQGFMDLLAQRPVAR